MKVLNNESIEFFSGVSGFRRFHLALQSLGIFWFLFLTGFIPS